jgi:hypothetical protein
VETEVMASRDRVDYTEETLHQNKKRLTEAMAGAEEMVVKRLMEVKEETEDSSRL